MAQMWFTDKFFGKKKNKPQDAEPVVSLDSLTFLMGQVVPRIRSVEPRPSLIQARLADGYRAIDLSPLPPHQFLHQTKSFDDEAWRRLALSVACLDDTDFSWALYGLSEKKSAKSQIVDAFLPLARDRTSLTMDLFYESELRVEEYARHLTGELGLEISGESPEESEDLRYRLDYARLLEEADKARLSAEDRIEYLRKLQEEEEARRAPRGKW